MPELEIVLESLLFAAGDPISVVRLATLLDRPQADVLAAADGLAGRLAYDQRGIRLVRMDKQLQLVSAPEHGDLCRLVLEERKPTPFSKAALEVLSLLAYYQPITRAQIERVRGVESSATLLNLIEKGLATEAGRLDVPGKPYLYKTTPGFLRMFGLSSLDELPKPDELEGQLTLPGFETEVTT